MNDSTSGDHKPEAAAKPVPMHPDNAAHPEPGSHPDPITGEPDAHPVGVGVGALGAGAAGAMVGAFIGPIGVAIGAVVGAVMGGLAGKEVAHHAEEEDASKGKPASALGDIYPAADPVTGSGREVPGIDEMKESYATDDAGPLETPTLPPSAVDAVPFSAPASPGDEFLTQRVPLTSEDTHVHVENVPNDVPDISSSKAPKDHDVLLGAPPASGPAATSSAATSFEAPGSSGDLEAVPLASVTEHSGDHALDSSSSTPTYLRAEPADEVIRTSAYYRYLERERTGRYGDELADWIEAEDEVLQTS